MPITRVHLVEVGLRVHFGVQHTVWSHLICSFCLQPSACFEVSRIFSQRCEPNALLTGAGPEKKNDCEFVLNRFAHKHTGTHTSCMKSPMGIIDLPAHHLHRCPIATMCMNTFKPFLYVCVCALAGRKTQSKLMHSNLTSDLFAAAATICSMFGAFVVVAAAVGGGGTVVVIIVIVVRIVVDIVLVMGLCVM